MEVGEMGSLADRLKPYQAGYDDGFARAVAIDKAERSSRMSPPEYFWNYEFRFDLRDATRSEQEAVRTLFLARRLELDGFTPAHVVLVELVLGREAIARQSRYLWDAVATREP
jgi:hypothetical protein